MSEPVRFRVYSDYLCPWCYNGAVRLRRLEDEYEGRIELDWHAYLLRPNPTARTPERLEKFRVYTRSWQKPAAEEGGAEFQVWSSDEGPPTHSLPAHVVAKASLAHGREAFRRMHDRLLRAYFVENRDISHPEVLAELWNDVGLPAEGFARVGDSELRDRVLDEFAEARERGVTGVPAMQLEGNDAVIVGAHPEELYRRWFDRSLARAAAVEEARS